MWPFRLKRANWAKSGTESALRVPADGDGWKISNVPRTGVFAPTCHESAVFEQPAHVWPRAPAILPAHFCACTHAFSAHSPASRGPHRPCATPACLMAAELSWACTTPCCHQPPAGLAVTVSRRERTRLQAAVSAQADTRPSGSGHAAPVCVYAPSSAALRKALKIALIPTHWVRIRRKQIARTTSYGRPAPGSVAGSGRVLLIALVAWRTTPRRP